MAWDDAPPKWDELPPSREELGSPGLLARAKDAAIGGLVKIGQTVDKYSGAPTRAAIGSLQDDMTDLGGAARAFKNQFGEDPTKAPTGRDIVRRAGVPDTALSEVVPSLYSETGDEWGKFKKGGLLDPTASGAAGFAMDVAADPTTLLPVAKGAQLAVGGVKKGLQATTKVAKAAGNTVSSAGTYVATKVGNLISGVPEKEIETYIKHYPEVQKLIKKYADNMPDAADKIREGFQASIRAKRAELGKQVGQALQTLPDEKVIDVGPIIAELQKVQSRMNKTLRLEEVKQVDELVGRIQAVAGDSGKLTPKELFDVKEFLQERGSAAFMRDGQIFVPGKDAQIAAKNASGVARKTLNTVSPTIAQANGELSKLHVIESKINKNLIAPGKSDSAIFAAGSGNNARNAKNLKRLEDATGASILGQAEKLSAAKRFSNPGLSAMDSTGKAAERMAKVGLIGLGAGGLPGAAIAASLTSPMALKLAIQTGRVPIQAFKALMGGAAKVTDETLDIAYKALQTPAGRKAFDASMRVGRAASVGEGKTKGLLRAKSEEDRKPADAK